MSPLRHSLLVWLGLLAAALISSAALAATVALDTQAERTDLSNSLALLRDAGGQLHFTEVATMDAEFRAVAHRDLQQSFNAGVFWLRFSLLHSGAQAITRWLVVGTPKVGLITLYMRNADSPGGWQVLNAGRNVPRAQKPVVATDAAFPVTLTPGDNLEFLIRIDARGATDMVTTLWEPQAYRLAAGERNLFLAAALGGILLGSQLALIVFVRLRETRYLWLALMLIAISGVEAMRENLFGIYLWPAQLPLPPSLLSVFAGLAVFALAKVVTAALDLSRTMPMGNRLFVALRWIGLFGMALSFIDYGAGVRVISLITVILLPASLIFSGLAWRRNHPSARVFTLAFALALLVETARQLANLGLLPWAAAMNFSMAGFLLATPFILLGMVDQTRQLADQLAVAEQLQAAKSAFLARVSHELRSPLNTILGFARMLQRGSTRLPLQEGTAGIEKSALRLLVLIDELLDSSRAAAGKLAVSPAPTLFIPWLNELCASAAIVIEAHGDRGNRFACERSGDLPEAVVIDGQRLRQVLENLLNNANRHTHRGDIRLECCGEIKGTQATLSFAVRDSGEGIAPERLKTIFEPFVRGDAAEQDEDNSRSGFGLGLPICRELVHQMGGEIEVSSTHRQGSCFSFTLRCPLATAPRIERSRAVPVPQPEGEFRPRILLVDDDPQQLQLLGDLLDDAGFVTQEAGNGKAALAAVTKSSWDAVITDQMMADGDGWFVLREVRAAAQSIPVILLSAALPQRPADFPADLDFNAVLRKPAMSEDLLATLWGVILKVDPGGTALTAEQWQALATLASDGDVSGIDDWIAALPESAVSTWARSALHRLDFDLLQRSAMIKPCQKS
jgi:signal transduction histidine kinase